VRFFKKLVFCTINYIFDFVNNSSAKTPPFVLEINLDKRTKNKYTAATMPTKDCKACQSCLMPFEKDRGVREDPRYCSYCFKNGKLCYEGDLKGFQKIAYKAMREDGINALKATLFTFMIRFAPRWKNTK